MSHKMFLMYRSLSAQRLFWDEVEEKMKIINEVVSWGFQFFLVLA